MNAMHHPDSNIWSIRLFTHVDLLQMVPDFFHLCLQHVAEHVIQQHSVQQVVIIIIDIINNIIIIDIILVIVIVDMSGSRVGTGWLWKKS